jgi:cytochrome c5
MSRLRAPESGVIGQLLKDAIAGVDDMPAKGGCSDCTEAEIKAAIQYMLDSAK